ncbi:MAG TPA: hypothetical protein VFA47_00225 [Candidatus Manganitrophaceae bacterium]|nr:hypothetical protein [Candidatus Manganitrophaceae bacterium]
MTCPKCNDRQYPEQINTEQGSLTVWKCIGCGNAIDPVILMNRQRRKTGLHGAKQHWFLRATHGKKASNG